MKKKRISEFLQRMSVGRNAMKGMYLALVLVLSFSLDAFSTVSSQAIHLKMENATLREVFKGLKEQTGVYFAYNEEELDRTVRVSVEFSGVTIEEAMRQILKGLPYSFECLKDMVVIKPSPVVREQVDETKVKLVKGRVTDVYGKPLSGVHVIVEGALSGSASNTDGNYAIMVENRKGIRLFFTYIGMATEIRVWKGESVLDVRMREAFTDIDEVVVTGYQTVSRRESASAVSTVKADKIYLAGAPSIDQMLQGQIPGLVVMNTSGEPSATPKIRIRGTSTINGNKAPVWVVDGVILEQSVPITASELNSEDAEYLVGNAIAGLSPQDIESITVLKDASATAIYGIKAANGVIVLTTKKGRAGKPTVSYHGEMVVNQRPSYRKFDLMDSAERMKLSKDIFEDGIKYSGQISLNREDSYEGLLNDLINRNIDRKEFATLAMEMAGRNTDWFEELFRNSVTHNHALSVQGGMEHAKYYFSAGYNSNEGAAKGSSSERFTSLAKVDVQLNRFIDFTAKIDYSTTENEGYSVVNPFTYAYRTSRTLKPFNEDGSYHMYKASSTSAYQFNVLNELRETGRESKTHTFNGLLNLNVKLLDGLTYQGTFSYHNSVNEQKDWKTEESNAVARIRRYDYKAYDESADEYWKSSLPYGGVLMQGSTTKDGYTIRNAVNYIKVFKGIHDVNIFAGSEIRGTKYKGMNVTGYGWTPSYGERFMPVYTEAFKNGYALQGALLPHNTNNVSKVASFFGSASYSYNNRYVFNFNIRSDGANKFGSNPKYRWLPTWSVAGKWTLTNEHFLSSFADRENYLAIRGSYGVQGNIHDDITPNLILKIDDRNPVSNLDRSSIYRLPNPDLRWEKTSSWNVALDFVLLSGRLSGSLDVYRKHTEDLIMDKTVAASNGRQRLFINAGKMDNRGVEGNLSLRLLDRKDLNWNFNLNFGRNINEVKLANDDFYSNQEEVDEMLAGNLAIAGDKAGSLYSFRYGGLSDKNGYPLFYGKDGKLYHSGDPTRMELVKCGSVNPDVAGGFDTQLTYKGRLSLSLGFTYSIGGVKRLPAIYSDRNRVFDPVANVSTRWNDRWRKPGDVTDIPALYDSDVAMGFLSMGLSNVADKEEGVMREQECTYFYDHSDLRVADADYLRLRLVGLSWQVPEKSLRKCGISSMMLRLQATNLWVWADSKWEGLDPETPESNIPLLPAYSFGINVTF